MVMHKMVMPMVMPMVTPMGSAPVHSVGHHHTLPGMRQLSVRPQATRMAGMRVTVVTQTLTLGMAMEL